MFLVFILFFNIKSSEITYCRSVCVLRMYYVYFENNANITD